MAAIHSSVLSRVSRAKSCRCVTSRAIKYVSRGLPLCELMRIAFGVMLSMVRSSSGGVLGLPLAPDLESGVIVGLVSLVGRLPFCF